MSTLAVPESVPAVIPLASLEPGQSAVISAVDVPGEIGERLLEMGMTAGTSITLVRRGLWGDPLQVRIRGYMLTLRRAQAQLVHVIADE